MDAECAFCGLALSAAHRVFCSDCQTTHSACPTCANDVPRELEGYRLVA